MHRVKIMRPFVPAKDFQLSQRFYQALGFEVKPIGEQIAFVETGGFSFILQNYFQKDWAENFMMQLVLEDLDGWWRDTAPENLADTFGVQRAQAPAMRSWGLRVGFIYDPSGALWHVTETH